MGCSHDEVKETTKLKRRLSQFSGGDIKKNYELIYVLGTGAFGKVRLYRDRTNNELLYAIKTLKCNSKEILHIGDSFKSDYLEARKKGIDSIYYRRRKNKNISNNLEKNLLNEMTIDSNDEENGDTMPKYNSLYNDNFFDENDMILDD